MIIILIAAVLAIMILIILRPGAIVQAGTPPALMIMTIATGEAITTTGSFKKLQAITGILCVFIDEGYITYHLNYGAFYCLTGRGTNFDEKRKKLFYQRVLSNHIGFFTLQPYFLSR